VQIYSAKLAADTKRVMQLRAEIARKAEELRGLVFEVEELNGAAQVRLDGPSASGQLLTRCCRGMQRLLESAHQELDFNKERYEQVARITANTREVVSHIATVKAQLLHNRGIFAQKCQEVRPVFWSVERRTRS
jgi:hypothetical protein